MDKNDYMEKTSAWRHRPLQKSNVDSPPRAWFSVIEEGRAHREEGICSMGHRFHAERWLPAL